MPVISFSINESLKKFINKLVTKNKYENKSKLIRDALLRLMSTMDASNSFSDTSTVSYDVDNKILGNTIFVIPNDLQVKKKLNKVENDYNHQIISKNQHFYKEGLVIFYFFEGDIQDFQKMVVEINSIKDIKNFRYLIIN
ncbi:MAG: CopG family ribbon-helix-helix protein [Promethearchaeota archaeon]